MKRDKQIRGFTLLEMLTALAIVVIMISLLIPAIQKIGETAHMVKQKAQFHAIEVGLETFRVDTGDYPPSNYTLDGDPDPKSTGTTGYCGAQKLAEAMVGWDGFGYHPKSAWRSDGIADFNGDGIATEKIYDTVNGVLNGTLQTAAENLKVRKGPYLELEKSNAVKLSSIYPDDPKFPTSAIVARDTYVLADMFGTVYHRTTGKKTGMPILYYRADTSKTMFKPPILNNNPLTKREVIYNVDDNAPFFMYVSPTDEIHPMASDRELFYKRIANPNFTSPQRPYRAQSFILLSAGADGLYGSPDDVYNIDENEK
jgi:prepilin-type N-terminal cleavage/methylation domain-containing protein